VIRPSVFTQTMPLLSAGGVCAVEVLGAAILAAGVGAGAGVEVELDAGAVAAEFEELFAGADQVPCFVGVLA
jgi:hypothetical protein